VRTWHVVHRRGKQLLPIAQAFCDFVRDKGAAYAEASSAPASRGASAVPTRSIEKRARNGKPKHPASRTRAPSKHRR